MFIGLALIAFGAFRAAVNVATCCVKCNRRLTDEARGVVTICFRCEREARAKAMGCS